MLGWAVCKSKTSSNQKVLNLECQADVPPGTFLLAVRKSTFLKENQINLFEPWPSIEILTPCLYTVTEKLDGSNLCLSITSKDFHIYTRQGKDAFESIPVLKKHQELFKPIEMAIGAELHKPREESVLPDFGQQILGVNVYGEFLNFLNMKRIKYCPPKEALFKVFGAVIIFAGKGEQNSYRLIFPELEKLLGALNLTEQYLVPVIARHIPISKIFDNKALSLKSAYGTAQVEGWVFHPESSGATTYKLKTPQFLERLASDKKRLGCENDRDREELYKTFFTESRAFSVKSKFGTITDANLGEVVAFFLKDVKEEATRVTPELLPFFYSEKAFKINQRALQLMARFKE